MTTVEKRRSGRKSGRHRKQSDGGYSDTSSGGSFLDENDREVSNLTDRAFRSLCIGDEAVYNDSDLGLSSPCSQRDRQLAFSHSGHDGEREELKRAAHENFSLRLQQYEQDWIHGGMYGAEIHRDPQWELYGERTQGRVSATFQHSFVDTYQQEKSLREEQLSLFSNGTTELNSQQPRSRSRVSSLIRAFNSEGHRDDSGIDDRFKEWNNETSWDKSALMSFQRELSEFSTSYQQNFNSSYFPSAGPFSPQDNNFYSSEVAAMAHMSHNSATSFMRSSHSKHSMSAQVNCNSNFFIHSEFSPFKVWRDHNRFPFQHGQVSGFLHGSDFPQWYETPMYKEISMRDQPQDNYRGIRQGHLAPAVPPMSQRSTSTSTMLQKAPSVEKRCESELAGQYPQWKRTQKLGTNRLQSQRPSTASPTIEMSRRVRDTISSVKALQQKIKMMTEHNITTGMITNPQGGFYGNENLTPFGNNGVPVAPNVVSNNTSTTPFNISQLLTPSVNPHQEAETSDLLDLDLSAQPVEHAPVRAESRGVTPDVRTSSYKTRATSLLFNLKDNRKRVKSTYSPTKFKGLEIQDKNKHPSTQEPRDTVIDIPDFPDSHYQYALLDESNRMNAHEYVNQYQSPMMQPAMAQSEQFPSYILSDYQATQMQGQTVHHSGFTGFIPENYTSNQLTNGQNLHEDLTSFAPNKEVVSYNAGTLEGDVYKLKPGYTATEPPRLNAVDYQREGYLKGKGNTEQPYNDMVGRGFTEVHRDEQLKDNKHVNVSSQDRWRQTKSQDASELGLKADFYPLKQETAALLEKTRQQSMTKEHEKVELRESFDVGTSYNISNQMLSSSFSNDTLENPAHYGQQQPMTFQDNNALQKYYGQDGDNQKKEIQSTKSYNRHSDQEFTSQNGYYYRKDKLMAMEETGQPKQYAPIRKDYEMQSLQQTEPKPQLEHNLQTSLQYKPDQIAVPVITNQMEDEQLTEVKSKQVIAEHMKAEITQAELAKAKQCTQMNELKEESAGSILAGEKVGAEQAKSKQIKQEMLNQAKPENIEEKIKEQTTSKQQLEPVKEEHKKAEQTTVQKVADEVRNIKDKTADKHLRDEVWNQVKAEQKETEKGKEQHKLAKIDLEAHAQMQRAKLQQVKETPDNARLVPEKELSKDREAEQIIKENIDREKIEKDTTIKEDTKIKETKESQTKADQETKTKIVEKENFKTDQIKTRDVKQPKDEENFIEKVQVKTKNAAKEIHSAKETNAGERKADQVKLEQTKEERFKAELTKAENMLGKSSKLTAKLTGMQQARSEPDKVQQVKTELAKAKAELAKIKEKMRGEQKEKVRNATSVVKDDSIANTTVPLGLKVNNNLGDKKEQQPEQVQKQKEDLEVRKVVGQPDRGADEYDRLREKYGFIQAALTNKKLVSETEALSVDKVETVSEEKSSDDCSPKSKVSGGNKENMKEESNFMVSEVTDSQYVYSESSKEFKLSSVNDPPTISDKKLNNDNNTDKVKDYDVDKFIKCDPVKDPDVALKKGSDLTKQLTSERHTKPTERSIAPTKDLHTTPPKVLPHKERDQAKQEILTSKIKAHAEKEISAMKEKGFAKRDGSKMSTKQLASSQSVTVRQKPPSQDMHVKSESITSSSITPKHQKEAPAGVELEVVSSWSEDHLQKQDQQKIQSSKIDVQEPPCETNKPGSCSVNSTNNLVEKQKKEHQPEKESAIQTKEQPLDTEHRKIQVKHQDNSGKQEEELKDKLPVNTKIVNKKREDPTGSENPTVTDSEPSVAVVLGHREPSAPDENLQIMGIMVSVHERNPPLEMDHGNNNTPKLINTTEKEPSRENRIEKAKGSQKTHSIPLKDEAKAENMQENSTLETRQIEMTEDVIKTNLQPEDSSTKAESQWETQPQPVAENGVTVTVLAKNKVLAETQTLLNQDRLATEIKDQAENKSTKTEEVKTEEKTPPKIQTRHTNDNLIPEVGNTVINKKHNAETPITYGVLPSVKEDTSGAINHSLSSNSDDKSVPLLKEKRHDSTPPKAFNEAGPSKNSTENENKCVSPKHQLNETQVRDVYEEDDEVHIDSVAIRIVPAGPKKDDEKVISSSDVVLFDEHKQVTSSGCEEKTNTLQTEDMSKVLCPTSTENAMIDNATDKVGVHSVLSRVSKGTDSHKTNNQQSSINVACDNTGVENGNPPKVKTTETLQEESNTQHVEEDYFQVHGVRDTSNEVMELSEIMQNKTDVKKTFKEDKNEAFVFKVDQDKSKTMESSSVRIENESMRRKKCETEDKLPSKQSDGTMERWSNNEKMEEGQANQIRRHHTEEKFSLSEKEIQSSSPHPTRKNRIQEKPEPKPKQKEKVSTIPEISALADYARLKVIVSEESDVNPVQEFPPNKKEGFFPLIHTRHSRRPVFTVDTQEHPVKEKRLPNKTERDAKVNKELKAVVFPITEKEHQRTGMFKLGDKESGTTHAHNIDKKSPPTTSSSSTVSQSKNTSEGWTHFDEANPLTPLMVQMQNRVENLASLRKEGRTETQQNKDRGSDTNKLLNERPVIQHKETRGSQQGKIKELKEKQPSRNQEEKQEDIRIKQMVEEKRASLAEEEKRALQREEERRARDREAIAIKIKESREKRREAEKRAEEERKEKQKEEERSAQKEETRANQMEEEMRITANEQIRGQKIEEEIRANMREQEQQKRDNEWKRLQKQEEARAAQEQQKLAVQVQQQRTAAQEEQQRRAAQEEQQKRAAQEEQQRREAQKDQQRKAAQEEQQRRAAQEEQQQREAQEEQQKKAAQELKRRAAEEEQQRKAAQEEQKRKAALFDEQQRRAAQEEQQRRAAQEEQQRRAAQEEQQRRAAQEEQQQREAQEKQQKKAAQEEQKRRAALIHEQQRRAAQEEQQRRAAQEEQQKKAALEEMQKRNAQDEKQRGAAKQAEQKTAEQKEQQRRALQLQQKRVEEEQQRVEQEERKIRGTEEEQKRRAAQEEQQKTTAQEEQLRRAAQEQRRRALQEENERAAQEEQQRRAAQEEQQRIATQDEQQTRAAQKAQQTRVAQEKQRVVQKGDESQTKKKREEERLVTYHDDWKTALTEKQKQAAQKDALQYYAITSAESEKKARERQLYSPLPSQPRNNPTGLESTDRQSRPHAPPSPAPSLPRSTTSSPALGVKPSMFRVKDNTMKGSSLTKSVKPRFHKNFGEDVRGGSPMDRRLDIGEAEQEIMRRSSGTPVHPDTGLNRLAAINDSSTSRSASSSLGYSTPVSHHRPYSRRSIVMDEDDSRSVISTMSEDVDSIATSAADLADLRGLYDSDRPESACSFSSDISRLGKPPTVPPKSEKALRRAQRLTTRRIKKELSKLEEKNPAEVQKEVSITDSTSSSNEVRSPNRNAVTSPHFSSPVSLAHAPTAGSSLHSSYVDHQSSNRSFHASPHATGPISIPNSSSHATAAISFPAAPKSVAHVPSSPTLHHANHPAPVTQYHVESSYPQAYPLTQRKVLQDLGSGQYFVVDVPVKVKTKTFIDPETGKYVQLNVRESGQRMPRPPPQQKFPQPPQQPQLKSQQEPSPQAPSAGKPIAFHQGYHGHPHSHQPHQPPHLSSEPGPPQQDQQPVRETHSYGYPAREMGQTTEGHRYSPEKTPYMDTVNNKDKMHNTVYGTQGSYESFPECDTNSQLAGRSVCENDNSAHSQYQPRDIITMGELEDFMELSDW